VRSVCDYVWAVKLRFCLRNIILSGYSLVMEFVGVIECLVSNQQKSKRDDVLFGDPEVTLKRQ
jgi:hypothetical protein